MLSEKANRQLVEYFKKNLAKGYTQDSLRFSLGRQGYSRALIDKAMEQANREIAMTAPVIKREEPEIVVTEEPIEPPKRSWFKRLFGLD
ncbi:Uncharacterised protein [uncultured archaeon]|nr:Uncharacterised protein [uncultured archaeon]